MSQVVILANESSQMVDFKMDAIPETGTIIYVATFKLYDGSGSPSRVFATYSDGAAGGTTNNWSSKWLTVIIVIVSCYINMIIINRGQLPSKLFSAVVIFH